MANVSISIPQLGEGLQEARLIRFLKQPGESVKRDEPLFEMETDKAISEVESPYSGIVREWTVEEDSVHPIGAAIGTMEVEDSESNSSQESTNTPTDRAPTEAKHVARSTSAASESTAESVPIPPRTRRYLKEKNLEAVAAQIPAAGSRLTEHDVDRYLENRSTQSGANGTSDTFTESALTSTQQTLNYRMARGVQVVVPAVLETDLDWRSIQSNREQTRDADGPTSFAMALWCIAKAMCNHDPLRSSLAADGKQVRTYDHVNLGIAVALPNDELKTAVVRHADTMSQKQFFEKLVERIEAARGGEDQVDATTTVSVSNIGATDMRAGIPVVVAPAVATLAIGRVSPQAEPSGDGVLFRPFASLTMSFDHRLPRHANFIAWILVVSRTLSTAVCSAQVVGIRAKPTS